MKETKDTNFEVEKGREYLKLTLESYKHVGEVFTEVEKKIGNIFAAATTIIGIVTALGYFVLKESLKVETLLFVIISLVCLFLAVIIGFYLHRVGHYGYIDPTAIFVDDKEAPLGTLLYNSAATLASITDDNVELIASKEKWINAMISLIFLGLFFAIIGFIFFSATSIGS